MFSRRGFLKGIAGALFVASVNLEQFKFLPPDPEKDARSRSSVELLNEELEKVYNKVPELFERDSIFFATLDSGAPMISTREMRVPFEIKTK